jgi:hypothetical protein
VAETAKPLRLREALWQARIEAADRTGVVVDLRDAEVARLEILNEGSIRCSRKCRIRSIYSIGASAKETRRGCGSTLSPMF